MDIPTGYIVEIIHKNKPTCALVKETKNKKITVILPSLQEKIINQNEIIYIDSQKTTNIQKIKEKNEIRNNLKDQFNLEEIWQILDEKEYNAIIITELYLNKKPSDDDVASLLRKIIETQNYFQITSTNTIKKLSLQKVNEIFDKLKKQQENTKKEQELQETINKLLNQSNISDNYWINQIKNYVIYDQCQNKNIIQSVLQKNNLTEIPKLFEILVKNKIVEEDLFYDYYRLHFPSYSEKEIQQAQNLKYELNHPNIKDLTTLETFTIDSEDTTDFDDAISIQQTNQEIIIYIHISNTAFFINEHLFEGALKRNQTLYLPDQIIHMLPPILAEQKFSLKKQELKYTTTFKFTIDNNTLEIKDFQPLLSIIKVKNNLTYQKIDNELNNKNPLWNQLYQILLHHKNKRLQNGAYNIILPEVTIKIINGELIPKKIEMTKSRDLISEAMIMTNNYCAKFLHENKIPIIYRTQKEPNKIIPINNIADSIIQLKYFNKVELSLQPRYHSGLGITHYTTITSPIRRFLDLLNQKQLISILLDQKYLSENEILSLLPEIESSLQRAQYLQNRRNKYFLLKYLQNFKQKTQAIVIETDKNKSKLYLPEFNIIGIIKNKNNLKIYDTIEVKVKYCNPYLEYLELE